MRRPLEENLSEVLFGSSRSWRTLVPYARRVEYQMGQVQRGSVVVDFLFIVTPIVGVCNCSMFCCTLLYVHSSIAIILMGKRELIALLNLSSWSLVMVERLFLAVPRGCLQVVIVVFLDHTHLLFLPRRWKTEIGEVGAVKPV